MRNLVQSDTQLFLDILPAHVLKSRAYMRAHVRTHAHAHTRAHTPRAYAPPCVTRASAHEPRVRPCTRSHALPRPCAPVCVSVCK